MTLFRLLSTCKSSLRSIVPAQDYVLCTSCRLMSGNQEQTKNMFFDDEVQNLLHSLTRMDLKKVFRRKKDGTKLEPPEYVFMTTSDLEKAQRKAFDKGKKKLQMPPVLPPRDEREVVLEIDPKLDGAINSNFVFTDISFGKSDRSRPIVVREPNGKLRFANMDERSRMNEIYFPRPGREVNVPAMFEDANINSLLERREYEFILDRACAQFEPDDPLYIKTCRTTYDWVDRNGEYNALRSTRHYGPLVFHLCQTKNIDNLLKENIESDRVEDAVWLITLYGILNKVETTPDADNEIQLIQDFIEKHSRKKDDLQLTFNAYKGKISVKRKSVEQ